MLEIMIWFLIIGIGLAIGDVLMNHWADSGSRFVEQKLFVYLLALVVYISSLTLYAYQLKTNPLSVATITPMLINVTIIFLVSVFYFHEKITGYQLIGIILAILAIFFLHKW